jgi:dienelactone hydrolase
MYSLVLPLVFLPSLSLALPQTSNPLTGPSPKEIDGSGFGGIFGIDMSNPLGLLSSFPQGGGGILTTDTKKAQPKIAKDVSGGSGAYKAGFIIDPGLVNHTIYAPKTAPSASVKMPVIVWGNGGCFAQGRSFENFLTEIARHGYLILASGPPQAVSSSGNSGIGSMMASMSGGLAKASDMTTSIDWIVKTAAANSTTKYGTADVTKIAVAGQSCGGLEAYSAGYKDPRVKQIVLFNSGLLDKNKQNLLLQIKTPVSYFLGGPTDAAYLNGSEDFKKLPAGLRALLASYDMGHIGTYFEQSGGAVGKAAVKFFDAVFKGDVIAKALFTDPASELIKEGWNITTRNWN